VWGSVRITSIIVESLWENFAGGKGLLNRVSTQMNHFFLCSYPIPHLQASDAGRLAAFLGNDIQIHSLDEVLTAPPNPCE